MSDTQLARCTPMRRRLVSTVQCCEFRMHTHTHTHNTQHTHTHTQLRHACNHAHASTYLVAHHHHQQTTSTPPMTGTPTRFSTSPRKGFLSFHQALPNPFTLNCVCLVMPHRATTLGPSLSSRIRILQERRCLLRWKCGRLTFPC